MNFISSVLIAEAGEENGFYVLMYLLITHEMSTLFLPVSNRFLSFWIIGISWIAFKKLSNGIIDQVSYAQILSTSPKNLAFVWLLHFKVVHDDFCLLSALWPAAAHFRYVYCWRVESCFQNRCRSHETVRATNNKQGNGRNLWVFPCASETRKIVWSVCPLWVRSKCPRK